MTTNAATTRGYVHCAHDECFAITIGVQGDLCAECREEDAGHDHTHCAQCDNDSDVEVACEGGAR